MRGYIFLSLVIWIHIDIFNAAPVFKLNGYWFEILGLQVRSKFKNESSFEYKADWITVLKGSEEGAYLWV